MSIYQATEKTISVYLVCLVCLVERNKPNEPDRPEKPEKPDRPDRPNRPNEQDRLADFFSILLDTRLPIPQREIELNQSIRPHPMLAQHRIIKNGVVLQGDRQCRHIFDRHR